MLPSTFAPQGFREKWDFAMKNLETDILWTFLIQSCLLEKTISSTKDHKGEVLTPLIHMPSSTEADLALSSIAKGDSAEVLLLPLMWLSFPNT